MQRQYTQAPEGAATRCQNGGVETLQARPVTELFVEDFTDLHVVARVQHLVLVRPDEEHWGQRPVLRIAGVKCHRLEPEICHTQRDESEGERGSYVSVKL